MGRISREVMFMGMSRLASMRSTCHRLNVGAMVVQNNNPIAVGWGGHEPGAPHCPGNTCPGIVPGNCPTIHAEVNALKKAEGILDDVGMYTVDLFVTHSPCRECSNYILRGTSLTVRRLFFEVPYRNTEHLDLLRYGDPDDACIKPVEIYEVTPAGYVVEYFTRQVIELP
jgi:dCMP deaminase